MFHPGLYAQPVSHSALNGMCQSLPSRNYTASFLLCFTQSSNRATSWYLQKTAIYETRLLSTVCRGSKRDSTFDNILKRPLKFPSEPSTSSDCQVVAEAAHHLACKSTSMLAVQLCKMICVILAMKHYETSFMFVSGV